MGLEQKPHRRPKKSPTYSDCLPHPPRIINLYRRRRRLPIHALYLGNVAPFIQRVLMARHSFGCAPDLSLLPASVSPRHRPMVLKAHSCIRGWFSTPCVGHLGIAEPYHRDRRAALPLAA